MFTLIKQRLLKAIFYGYLLLLLYWMFLGFSRVTSEEYMYNLTPFDTVKKYILYYDHFPFTTWIINLAGNVGVFVPFGLLLPAIYPLLKKIVPFFAVFVVGITCIEFLQMVSKRGSFDVDDIILNTVGALIGFCIYRIKRA
ncbi:VanZ family protein [Bacillus luteolus]|uniref:VanZ family protein n=1 Tax=Litchfieldia luteola TaxID=682179 RepID=A0ABR9QGX5_9BACI|nr:VanZ family protein [Cytobacillus luteolus]